MPVSGTTYWFKKKLLLWNKIECTVHHWQNQAKKSCYWILRYYYIVKEMQKKQKQKQKQNQKKIFRCDVSINSNILKKYTRDAFELHWWATHMKVDFAQRCLCWGLRCLWNKSGSFNTNMVCFVPILMIMWIPPTHFVDDN